MTRPTKSKKISPTILHQHVHWHSHTCKSTNNHALRNDRLKLSGLVELARLTNKPMLSWLRVSSKNPPSYKVAPDRTDTIILAILLRLEFHMTKVMKKKVPHKMTPPPNSDVTIPSSKIPNLGSPVLTASKKKCSTLTTHDSSSSSSAVSFPYLVFTF